MVAYRFICSGHLGNIPLLFRCKGNPLAVCAPLHTNKPMQGAILGIPLQQSCLMHQVVFLASLRQSPPPTASPLLNWVRPYKCGGYKAETPSLPCATSLAAENAASPQDRILYTHPDHGVALPVHTSTVRCHYQHTFPLRVHILRMEEHASAFKRHSLCTFINTYPLFI